MWCVVIYCCSYFIYTDIEIGKNICETLCWPVLACMGGCCTPGCRWWCLWLYLFSAVPFPAGCLVIWDLIESVSESLPTSLCQSDFLFTN